MITYGKVYEICYGGYGQTTVGIDLAPGSFPFRHNWGSSRYLHVKIDSFRGRPVLGDTIRIILHNGEFVSVEVVGQEQEQEQDIISWKIYGF